MGSYILDTVKLNIEQEFRIHNFFWKELYQWPTGTRTGADDQGRELAQEGKLGRV
jgi:hypothetical protein